MKIVYLLSHVPGPRFYKKMKKAKDKFEVFVVYRNKNFENFQTFFFDNDIKKLEIINGTFKSWKVPVNFYYKFSIKALKNIKEINPQIIHCANLDMLLIALIYKKLWNNKVKVVYEVGDLNKRTFNTSRQVDKILIKNGLRSLEKRLVEKIDKLIISSQYFWDDYYKEFIEKEKTFLFPNAPEKEKFSEIIQKNQTIKTIGFIGRVRYFDQMKMLVDVVGKINQKMEKMEYKILIAGVGPDSDKISEITNGKDFVELYGPYNYDKEIVQIYSSIDFVYSVYDAEIPNVRIAIPNRLDEAIVSQKPIIVAKDTLLADFVRRYQIGFEVDSAKSFELEQLLERIMYKEIDVEKIKQNCKEISDSRYIDSYQNDLLIMYEELV